MLEPMSREIEEYFSDRLLCIDSRTNAFFQLRGVFVQKKFYAFELIRGIEEFLNGGYIVTTTRKIAKRLVFSISDQYSDVSQ